MTCGASLRNGRSPARKRKLIGISLSEAQRLDIPKIIFLYDKP